MTKPGGKRTHTSAKAPAPRLRLGGIRPAVRKPGRLSECIRYLETRQPAMVESIRHMVEMESPSHHKKSVDLLGERLAQAFVEVGGRVQFHRTGKFGAHL